MRRYFVIGRAATAGGAALGVTMRDASVYHIGKRLRCSSPWIVGILTVAFGGFAGMLTAASAAPSSTPAPSIGVGPQYDTTHVYVAADDLDRFVASFVATFGGRRTSPSVTTITPTPSLAKFEAALTPAGLLSVFAFQGGTPYPFGSERTGYLVTDLDAALRSARANGAAVAVAPFGDPIGRDAIVRWPGGIFMQFYVHAVVAHSAPLATVPENRVYLSADDADLFIHAFVGFAQGKVSSDVAHAPGIEIGSPNGTYRRVRIESIFGKLTVLVTDGHLPYPYGRETTGYAVVDLKETLAKAQASGATVLAGPYTADGREAAMAEFPGGYIAEIHTPLKR